MIGKSKKHGMRKTKLKGMNELVILKSNIPIKNPRQNPMTVYSLRIPRFYLQEADRLGINLPEMFRATLIAAINSLTDRSAMSVKLKRPWKRKGP